MMNSYRRHVFAWCAENWDTIAIFVLSAIYFGYVGQNLFVDHDEGFYAVSGRLVVEGSVPYRDFFFPQMPYTAYIYGAWQRVFGFGIQSARWCPSIMSAGTATILYFSAKSRVGRHAGMLCAVLFCSHALVVEWATSIKTHAPTMFFTVACASMLLDARPPSVPLARATLAGFFGAVAVGCRLMVAPSIGLILLIPLVTSGFARSDRLRMIACLAGGAMVGALPCMLLWALDPLNFTFGNIGYHSIRAGEASGLVNDVPQKWEILQELLGLSHPVDSNSTGVQNVLILIGVVAAFPSLLRRHREEMLVVAAGGIAVAVSLMPSPAFVQYFVVPIPVLLLSAARGVPVKPSARAWSVISATMALSVLLAAPGFQERVVRSWRADWDLTMYRPARIDRAADALCNANEAGGKTAAFWPVYVLGCEDDFHLASANQFGFPVAYQFDVADRRRRHLFIDEELHSAAENGDVTAFAFGRFSTPGRRSVIERLQREGWQLGTRGDVEVWYHPR